MHRTIRYVMKTQPAARIALVSLSLFTSTALAFQDVPRGRTELLFDPTRGDWVEVAVQESGTDAGDLAIAKSLLAERKFAAARKAFAAWLKSYPDSDHRADALLHAGDTELYAANAGESADVWQAHEWYEEILNSYSGGEAAEKALRRELLVAELLLFKGQKRRIFKGMLRVSATDEALQILDRLIDERAPGSPVAEQALLMQANYHYEKGEFEEAERAYARLSTEFKRSRHERLAMQRSADAALASFAGIEFDDAPLLEAEERYRQYSDRYPKAATEEGVASQLARIRDSRAQKEFSTGQYYERAKQPRAAAFYYRSVVKNWPDTPWASQATQRLGTIDPGQPAPVVDTPATPPAETPINAAPAAPATAEPVAAPQAPAPPPVAPRPVNDTVEEIQPIEK